MNCSCISLPNFCYRRLLKYSVAIVARLLLLYSRTIKLLANSSETIKQKKQVQLKKRIETKTIEGVLLTENQQRRVLVNRVYDVNKYLISTIVSSIVCSLLYFFSSTVSSLLYFLPPITYNSIVCSLLYYFLPTVSSQLYCFSPIMYSSLVYSLLYYFSPTVSSLLYFFPPILCSSIVCITANSVLLFYNSF